MAKRRSSKNATFINGVFKAPQGGIKGQGKTGIYTGGLSPTVVKANPGTADRSVAPQIMRGNLGPVIK